MKRRILQKKNTVNFQTEVSKGVHKGKTIWLLGPNGAGKSTIASKIAQRHDYFHLDEDTYREMFTKELGHTDKDMMDNTTSAALYCKQLNDEGMNMVTSFLTIREDQMQKIIQIIGRKNIIIAWPSVTVEDRLERVKDRKIPRDFPFYYPEDLIDVRVDTSKECAAESAHNIMEYVRQNKEN